MAAKETAKLINHTNLVDMDPEIGKDHLHYMAKAIQNGDIQGEKAHRWLGWIQACIRCGLGTSLRQLKEINYKAQ